VGYVEGMSNILIKNLNVLDVTKRPIHCTDKKRETMYIKDNNVWEKDDEENNKTRIYQGLNGYNEVTYNTIDEFQEIVKYGNTYVFVIKVLGIWASKATISEPIYGIRFQVDKVFIIN
jgi:hypothetical protein